MKVLAVIVSLLLGVGVLLFFLRPWERGNWLKSGGGTAREAAPVAQPKPTPAPAPPQATPQTTQAPEPQAKRPLLARERAEAERDAALNAGQHHAIAPEAPTKRYFKVKVRDSGTLEVETPRDETLLIRLEGIEAREADQSCTKADGTVWPCGAKARAALTLFIRSRAVTCTLPSQSDKNEFAARCSVMNQDVATWLVRRGWVTPSDDAEPKLAEAMRAAKSERIGIWEER